jgi:hypothetical protein
MKNHNEQFEIDIDMLTRPNPEKIKVRNGIIDATVFSFGIEKDQSIIHFGVGSRNKSFLNNMEKKLENYTGIDVDKNLIDECSITFSSHNYIFLQSTIQNFIDENKENRKTFDWCIIDGLLDKNLYEDNQYEYIDTIIRESLFISNIGVIVITDGNYTINDDYYNPDFLMAFISSMYNRFTVCRLNEHQYLMCIYKHYL